MSNLSARQLAEAREWAGRLGVPEEAVIADAEAQWAEGYADAARQAAEAMDRIGRAGGGQMAPGSGPEPAELEAG